jgi:hypothetical protein
MHVLFDLQQEIDNLNLEDSEYIVPVGNNPPTLTIRFVDGVKTIVVGNRVDQISGLGITLCALPEIKAGDRITVTGRVPRESPAGSWGIALMTEESATRKAEECQLTQVSSPKSLFSLSYILCDDDLDNLIMVQTTRWGAINPTMDLFIDGILISREGKIKVKDDARENIYSFDTDENLQCGGAIAGDESSDASPVTMFLAQSGNPQIEIFMHNGDKALRVDERSKDWDGVDIDLRKLHLVRNNKYQIKVTGRTNGCAPEGSIITLQGLPGFSWRSSQFITNDSFFTLCHVLSNAEVVQWSTVRVTTNSIGANVSFYIFDIEIKRLGLL